MRGPSSSPGVQFFGALFRAAPGLAPAWWLLLAFRRPAPGRDRGRDGRADRRGEGRHLARGAAHRGRHRVRAVPGAHPAAPGGERQPRQPHRGVAVRPADDRDHARPPGSAHLEGPDAHDRPHRRRATSTSASPVRRSRSAWTSSRAAWSRWSAGSRRASLLFGFAWWAPPLLVGAWLSTHWLLRESAVWRDRNTDEVRTAQRARRVRVPARGRRRRRPRRCACSGSPTGSSTASRPAAASLRAAVEATRLRERPLAFEPARRARRQRARRAGRVARRRGRRPHQPRPHDRVPDRDRSARR